jgi:hypothetical protein
MIPDGLTGVTAIAAGYRHTVALKNDGTAVAWGDNNWAGQAMIPAGLTGVTAIAAGGGQTWLRVPTRPANPLTITNATVVADGTPKTLTITTANGRTPTTTTYNGSYTPPSAPGTYTVVSEADYLDSYGNATGTLVIEGVGQVISGFTALPAKTYGDAPFTITGVTGGASGQPVVFTSSDAAVATIQGTTVTITGAGTATITASQAGANQYAAATPVTQTLVVAKAQVADGGTGAGAGAPAIQPMMLSGSGGSGSGGCGLGSGLGLAMCGVFAALRWISLRPCRRRQG